MDAIIADILKSSSSINESPSGSTDFEIFNGSGAIESDVSPAIGDHADEGYEDEDNESGEDMLKNSLKAMKRGSTAQHGRKSLQPLPKLYSPQEGRKTRPSSKKPKHHKSKTRDTSGDHVMPSRKSTGVMKMKINAEQRDKEALQYMKTFTTNPYAARSAKDHRQILLRPKTAMEIAVADGKKSAALDHLHTASAAEIEINIFSESFDDKIDKLPALPKTEKIPVVDRNADPTLTWPLYPNFTNHSPTISSKQPQGAHNSGFYSKAQYNTIMANPLTRPLSRHIKKYNRNALQDSYPNTGVKNIESLVLMKDEAQVEEHLGNLIDSESTRDIIVTSLGVLIGLALEHEVIAKNSLFDKGGVSILLYVLERWHDDSLIQVKATELLEIMAVSNPLTLSALYKQNGIMSLFKAIRVIAGSEVKTPQSKKNNSVYFSNYNIQSQYGLNRTHKRTEFKSPEKIIQELIASNFDTSVLSQLENMSGPQLNETLNELALLFKKINSILKLNEMVSLDLDLEQALFKVMQYTQEIITCEKVLIYCVDKENGKLFPADYNPWLRPIEKGVIRDSSFKLGCGIAGFAAEFKTIVNSIEAVNHECFDINIDARDVKGTAYSILCIPLITDSGSVEGVIELVNKTSPDGETLTNFSEDDEFVVKQIALQLAIIIHNAQIYDALRRTQKKVEMLLETTKSLTSTNELEDLVQKIMESAKELLGADRCTLFLADTKFNQLKALIQGLNGLEEIRIPTNVGIAGSVYTTGLAVNIPDAYKDSRFNPAVDKKTGYNTRNILCMPIRNYRGESIGVTQMINKKSGPFGVEDERLLTSFSSQAAVAIEKSYLYRKNIEILAESENIKHYMTKVLKNVKNIIIKLDEKGFLLDINYPELLDIDSSSMREIRNSGFENWLFEPDSLLIQDIKRAFIQPNYNITVEGYDIKLRGKMHNITYIILQVMDCSNPELLRGVSIFIDDHTEEKKALEALGRYITPQLAKQILAEDGVKPYGYRKKAAVLCATMRGFSSLSEALEPEMVIKFLTNHIISTERFLNSYVDGNIRVLFGIHSPTENAAANACDAALKLKSEQDMLNASITHLGLKPFNISIAVNSGLILAGAIGSSERLEFSFTGNVIGCTQEMMSSLTEYYGVTMLITEFALREIKVQDYRLREIDYIAFKSSPNDAFKIFEVYARKDDEISEEKAEMMTLYQNGITAYRRRQFKTAMEFFHAVAFVAQDSPSQIFLERSQALLETPPETDWTGIQYH